MPQIDQLIGGRLSLVGFLRAEAINQRRHFFFKLGIDPESEANRDELVPRDLEDAVASAHADGLEDGASRDLRLVAQEEDRQPLLFLHRLLRLFRGALFFRCFGRLAQNLGDFFRVLGPPGTGRQQCAEEQQRKEGA